jgi:outer membrane protein assembly factor BamD (BamD/ComL family)
MQRNDYSAGLPMLLLCVLASVGCSGWGARSMTPDELSLLPRDRLASGQIAWNKRSAEEPEIYSERHDTSIKAKDFAPEKWPQTFKKLTGRGPDREVAEAAYEEGKSAYQVGVAAWNQSPDSDETRSAFLSAVTHLEKAAERWPDSTIEEDSLFMLGECQFFANEYFPANKTYEQLIELYPATRYMDKVQSHRFAIAKFWLDTAEVTPVVSQPVNLTDNQYPLNDWAGHARRLLDRIRLDDPTGKLADDATFMLGKAHYDAKHFFEAAETFADLRNNYPGSQHQFNAHVMEFQSRLAMYDGKHYDGLPLKQAEEVLRLILKRFPNESAEMKDQWIEQASAIRNMLAERDKALADYHANRGENLAARFYLESLIEAYPETDVARDAKTQLEILAQEPDEPAQVAKWLVDLFPEPRSTRPLIRTGSLR